MPRKYKRALQQHQQQRHHHHHHNEETPEETFAALNEMEENLRRLGLREESGAAPTTATATTTTATAASTGGSVLTKDTQAYLASIKKAKDEATRLRHEKEYRQFAAEEQKRENESMLTVVKKENALRDVIETAGHLLERETRLAKEANAKRIQKVGGQLFRAEEIQKKEALRERVYQMMKNTTASSYVPSQLVLLGTEESETLKHISKVNAAVDYCYTIAVGLVEVAMRVADGMYIISSETGLPVRRVPQDLSVTQWQTWVNEFVFPQTTLRPMSDFLTTSSLRDLCDPNYKNIVNQKEDAFFASNTGTDQTIKGESAENTRENGNKEENTITAENIIERVSAMQYKYEKAHISSSIIEATRLIKNNEEMKLRSELDKVRRQQDSQCPEEVAPGWLHRLPPVGCFVYGDDLSGLKALVDIASNDGNHDTTTATSQKRQWSVSTPTETAKGVSESGNNLVDNNIPYRVLTPFMLTRIPTGGTSGQGSGGLGATTSSGGGAGGGSGSYSPAGTKIKWNTTISYASGRTRDGKQQVEDITESKQYIEALTDALVKELITVYVNNLQLVMRSETETAEASTGATEAMRTLLLVNFPESENFWRILQQKLLVAIEGAEQEINRMLKLKELGEDMQTPPPVLLTAASPQGSSKGKSGQKTSTSQEASSGVARKKSPRSTLLSTGKKGAIRTSMPTNEEENEPQRNRVYPPLCLLGVFLQCDVPSRYRRMRMANQNPCMYSSDQRSAKTSTTTSGEEGGVESFADWSMNRLRHELIHQDRKMRRVLKTWCSNIAKIHIPSEPDIEKPNVERFKKRSRSTVIRKASDLAAINAIAAAAATPPPLTFPKVLFFRRKENISSASDTINPVEILINVLKNLLNPANRGIISHESLVSGQLVSPLRLSDYRFPSATLMRLVELQQRFQNRWNESTSTVLSLTPTVMSQSSTGVTHSTGGKESEVAIENAVLIETEMYRIFRTFSTDLLWFMSSNVFPPSLWTTTTTTTTTTITAAIGTATATTTTTTAQRSGNIPAPISGSNGEFFSRTVHFISVDKNYNDSRESLYGLQVEGMSRLTATCALFLYCVLNVTLTSLGRALGRLCLWARGHIVSISHGNNEMERVGAPGSPFTEAASEDMMSAQKMSLTSESAMQLFLDSVPRLSFAEVQSMVEQLDGEAASFQGFQRTLWSYASRVHETALDCFRKFVKNVCKEFGVEDSESLEAMASPVTRILLEHLFAFSPIDEKRGICDCNTSTISVTMGRAVAAIRALRRCCTIAGVCAARWIDSMYVTALAISPNGTFPVECRPTNIVDIFSPPELVEQVGGAPPPSLALQLLSTLAPALDLSSDEVRDCWRETEFEVILQNFSIYQKSVLDEEEFIHCMMQVQLNALWKFLPPRLHNVAARLGVTLPFPSNIRQQQTKEMEEKGKMCTNFIQPWFKHQNGVGNTKMTFVTERIASQMFHAAVQSQEQEIPKQRFNTSVSRMDSSVSTFRDVVVNYRIRTSLLHLREFFISAILQRLYFDDSSGSFTDVMQTGTFQEPSTMELRTMIRSVPPVLREQGPGDIPGFDSISMKAWKRIKWWTFFDDPSRLSYAAFIQRYMLRILTVCFGFVNGELCSRCVPFLPDVLYAVAATKGAQATAERYFHLLAALNTVRTKKLSHSHQSNRAGAATPPTPPAEIITTAPATPTVSLETTGHYIMAADGPLMAFEFTLSVEEALFFFQRAGEEILRGPCAKGLAHAFPKQPQDLQSAVFLEETKNGSSYKNNKDIEDDDDYEDDGMLPLEAELTLLLEIEKRTALSLPLLCATHWGQQITPRLTRIPFTENVMDIMRNKRLVDGEGTTSSQMAETITRPRSTSFI
ncbi:uncharacterized protein TM35_000181290 [Trypanosoma theileri]|uniref:Uncharacterized protein n=1 Tax=Trypanosoma theileri TaxID=67003 RepID=A0A1X0NTR5_9TRYP|nr:uncharacterized protein TM35_000181290 [Trypanosoma theileri]ORC88072.1 hypothetical protein TM35_000181290 [Trypanosoma theileri]